MFNFFSQKLTENALILLLEAVFLLNGLLYIASVPVFQAPDEYFHYATVQHYAEPTGYTPPGGKDFPVDQTTFSDISTQNLSPELKNFLDDIHLGDTRFDPQNTLPFRKDAFWGENEEALGDTGRFSHFVDRYPAWTTGYSPLYYSIAGVIESALSNHSILDRIYAIRIFSLLIGALTILFAFLCFRKLDLSENESALLAGTVAFQPMFIFITTSINIDALLFFSFTLFLFGTLSVLRDGPNKGSVLLSVAATILGIHTKQSGYFLVIALLVLALTVIFQKRHILSQNLSLTKKKLVAAILAFCVLAAGAIYLISSAFLNRVPQLKPFWFMREYLVYQSQFDITLNRSLSYWGNFGWLNIPISPMLIFVIWFVLALSVIGLGRKGIAVLRNKTGLSNSEETLLLQLFFLAFCVLGLDVTIHFINMGQSNIQNIADPTASIGTQGRYFLPVIVAKIALIGLGLSFLFSRIRRESIFLILFLGMITLNEMCLFDVIIPHYYL